MNFYKRYMGDYSRDTAHLSLAEHGAYTLLLDHYYSTEKPLPADPSALYRICRAFDKAEQRAVLSVADAFFPVGPGGLRHNARADRQIPEDLRLIETARENGRKGGRPRKTPPAGSVEEPGNNPVGFDSDTSWDSGKEPNGKTHQTPDTREKQKLQASLRSASSSASPDDPRRGELAERLAKVTDDAIAAWNASPLTKAAGGLLPNVSPKVGRERRQGQVKRCLRVARSICAEATGSTLVTREFWDGYFAAVAADDFYSGRQPGGRGHEGYVPDFELVTREATMLRIFDRSEAAA